MTIKNFIAWFFKLLWSDEVGSGNLIDYTRGPENTTDYPDYTWSPENTTDYPDYTDTPENTTDYPDYTDNPENTTDLPENIWNADYDKLNPLTKGTNLLCIM